MFVTRLQFVFIVHFIVSLFLVLARPLSVSFLIRTSGKAKLLLVVVGVCNPPQQGKAVAAAVVTPVVMGRQEQYKHQSPFLAVR